MQVETSNNHKLWIHVHLILLPVGFRQNRKSEQGGQRERGASIHQM